MHASQERPQTLSTIDLFQGVDSQTLQALETHVRVSHYKTGQPVVLEDDDSHDVYMILAGRLRVTIYSDAGKEILFRDLGAGQSFGEVAAIDGGKRSANVIALTDAKVGVLPAGSFNDILHRYPAVAQAVLKKLVALVRALSQRVEETTLSVDMRICMDLIRQARASMINDRAARLVPAPKHAAIASRVGTHREAVSRLMSRLQKQGITRKGTGDLMVLDVNALEQFARQITSD